MSKLSRNANNPYLEASKRRLAAAVFGIPGVIGVGTALDPRRGPSGWYFFLYVMGVTEEVTEATPTEWDGYPVVLESIGTSARVG